MKISDIQSNNNKLTFDIHNVDLPYVNGLRRIILSELPAYALNYLDIVDNTSKINNDKLRTKINQLPLNQSMGFVLQYENTGLEPVELTTDDLKLYSVNDKKFLKHMKNSFYNKILVQEKQRKQIVGTNYILPLEANKPKYTMDETVKNYLDNYEEKKQDLSVESDLHIITLDPHEKIDLYGITMSGTPKEHIKFQQANAYFRQYKEVVNKDIDWNKSVEELVEKVSKINNEDEYKENKILIEKILYKINSYKEYQEIVWTDEYKKQLCDEIHSMLKETCTDVYDKTIKTYSEYSRCIPCIRDMSYLLNKHKEDIYDTEGHKRYHFTISSNTTSPDLLWNQAIQVLQAKCEKFLEGVPELIQKHLSKNESMENGYFISLDETHTISKILVHELVKCKSISVVADKQIHPLHPHIILVIKWKKAFVANETNMIQVLTDAMKNIIKYVKQLPTLNQM